jgi:hypothetical protein
VKDNHKKITEVDGPIDNAEYVTLKSKDFKYPNKEEFIKFHRECPRLEIFGFKHNHPLALIVNDRMPMDEASRVSNLYWWDNCLINRFEKVCHTYIFLSANYSRGFSDDWRKNTHKQVINHIMFEYYAEVYYYYFFSSLDIIAQILCTYFSIVLKEREISFNKRFITSIKDQSIKYILEKFEKETLEAKKFRNSFTHRFTPNIPDNRSVISNDKKALNFGGGNFLQSERIKNNIYESLNSLSSLMTQLKIIIK